MNKEELVSLLQENKFDDLFLKLAKVASNSKKENLEQGITLLNGRYNQFKLDNSKGILSQSDARLEIDRIRSSTLDLINQVFEEELNIGENLNPKDKENREKPEPERSEVIPLGRKNRIITWGIIMVFWVCLGIMGFAPMSQVPIFIEVKTDYITLRTWAPWQFHDPLYLQSFYLENLFQVNGIGDTLIRDAHEEIEMSVGGKAIQLKNGLAFKNTSRLNLFWDHGEIKLTPQDDTIKGILLIHDGEVNLEQLRIKIYVSDSIGKQVHFSSTPGTPLWISLCQDCSMSFNQIPVDSLDLIRQIEIDPPRFLSSVKSGYLYVVGIPDTISLKENIYILPTLNKNGILDIKASDEGFSLTFEGNVQELFVGTKDIKSSIKPSKFKYYFYSKKIEFVLGFVILIIVNVTMVKFFA